MIKQKENRWILIREGVVRNVFNNRKGAIKHFKELLKQTLKDMDMQDKTNEYTYPIIIPETIIKPISERPAHLSLT